MPTPVPIRRFYSTTRDSMDGSRTSASGGGMLRTGHQIGAGFGNVQASAENDGDGMVNGFDIAAFLDREMFIDQYGHVIENLRLTMMI